MAMRPAAKSMKYDDFELYQQQSKMDAPPEPPEYPPNLCFMISAEDMEKAGASGGNPGDTMRFAAMGEVTSIFKDTDGARIELEVGEFAGEDGKFFDLSQPAHICLCGPELEKMDLEADCERGDMLHMVGTARLERSSDTEYSGQMSCLQVTDLAYVEDESSETREHMNDED